MDNNSESAEFDKLSEEQQAEAKKLFLETREKMKMPHILDALAANVNKDPYFGHTYALMVANPQQEEQVLLNLIEALSESNQRMAGMIEKLMVGEQSQSPILTNMHDHNVRRGQGGKLPKGGLVPVPGSKQP